LPAYMVDLVAERLAENIHELWSKGKIDNDWKYGPVRDDAQKIHPMLIPYEELTAVEKAYDLEMALETLKVLYALGYRITNNDIDQSNSKFMLLDPAKYRQANGYTPKPLDLSAVELPSQVSTLSHLVASQDQYVM
jgi:hypothetical protein